MGAIELAGGGESAGEMGICSSSGDPGLRTPNMALSSSPISLRARGAGSMRLVVICGRDPLVGFTILGICTLEV